MQHYYNRSLHKYPRPTPTETACFFSPFSTGETQHESSVPTLPMKSEYWETVPTHVFPVRERVRYHHQLRVNELTVSETLGRL